MTFLCEISLFGFAAAWCGFAVGRVYDELSGGRRRGRERAFRYGLHVGRQTGPEPGSHWVSAERYRRLETLIVDQQNAFGKPLTQALRDWLAEVAP